MGFMVGRICAVIQAYWSNKLLALMPYCCSLEIKIFFQQGPCIFILHWTLQTPQPVWKTTHQEVARFSSLQVRLGRGLQSQLLRARQVSALAWEAIYLDSLAASASRSL